MMNRGGNMRGMKPRYLFEDWTVREELEAKAKEERFGSSQRRKGRGGWNQSKAKDAAIAEHTSRSLNSTKENTRGLSLLAGLACCSAPCLLALFSCTRAMDVTKKKKAETWTKTDGQLEVNRLLCVWGGGKASPRETRAT